MTEWTPARILAAAAALQEDVLKDQTYRCTPIGRLVGEYIDRMRHLEYSPRTLERERLLAEFALRHAHLEPSDITTRLLETYLVKRCEDLAPATKENYTSTIRVFVAWLYDDEHISTDPGRRLKGPKVKGTTRRSHPAATIRRLVNAQESRMTRQAILFLYYCGLRRNELRNLQWADVDLEANVVVVTHAKGGTPNEVPSIHPAHRPHIVKYLAVVKPRPTDYVLHKQRKVRRGAWPLYAYDIIDHPEAPLSSTGVDKWWQRAVVLAGLPHFPMHELRHSIGTHTQEAGHDLYATKELLRHKSIATTERVYLHLEKRASVARVQALMGDPLGEMLELMESAEEEE